MKSGTTKHVVTTDAAIDGLFFIHFLLAASDRPVSSSSLVAHHGFSNVCFFGDAVASLRFGEANDSSDND